MRAFIRKKLIEGREYIYEVTPYYDPKTKTIRHTSKYLGKEIGGQIVKVRQNLPKRAYSYGEYLPFIKVVEEYAIRDGLGKYLTREEVEAVVILSINRAVEPLALKHIPGWYEGLYLYSADNAVKELRFLNVFWLPWMARRGATLLNFN